MPEKHPFITYLEGLREHDDRGALAALRRGLGQPPGSAVEMYRYVVPWVPDRASRQEERAYYLVAALFAYHPDPGGWGNLGAAFRRTLDPQGDNTAIERRFTALLAAHSDDLPVYLRQAVGFLKSKEVPINWQQLLSDLKYWDHPEGHVQRNWARAFWGRAPQETPAEETIPTNHE